jgi:hypothetical protein
MDRQYNDQKKHGQTIQRPKETWTGNIATKRNMDRDNTTTKINTQETWTGNTTTKRNMDMFLLVVVLPVHVSFGRCIVCPCFFWSLYCLSMFLLVVVLSVHVSFGSCIVCPCFFWSLYCLSMFLLVVGQAIQLPKETWTDNTTTKRNMDRQYNDQKKHGQKIQRPKETWTAMFLLVVVLSVRVSFGRCIVCPCFFWSLYCLSMFLLAVALSVHVSFGRCIVYPYSDNTTSKRNMDRQYNDQKKYG